MVSSTCKYIKKQAFSIFIKYSFFFLCSHGKDYQELNLDRLQHWITTGRIDASQPITMKHLLDSRCIHKIEDGVKLLSVVSAKKRNTCIYL